MSSWLGGIFKDPEKRAVLSWLGGGAVIAAGGMWAVLTFVVEHKDTPDKKGGTVVTVPGQGIASGGDTHINAPVSFGPSNEQIEQIQKPLAEQLGQKDAQIAAMTQMLLEKNPAAAAAPGARQAVGAAVQSIAEGAAEGDPRLQQALGLLKDNKTAEAARLLTAVAGDKTARIEQDRKEAAIAYRNLGAIARLGDPKQALEAYEKAVELDPDDLESLLGIGGIQIDYGDLNKAQARLERVLTLAKTDDQADYKYWALLGLGDIKQRRGNLAGALKSYNDDLAIGERLATSDPGNAGWQRDLPASYDTIGNVQVKQGDLAGAAKSYQDSLAIRERLAKSDPGNAGWQRDLPASYDRIGNVQAKQGDLAGALKSYTGSLAIAGRLANSDPGNTVWQWDLGFSNERIGNVQLAQGDLAAALKSYEAKRDIVSRLAKSDPSKAGWQHDLAVSFDKLALVHKQSGHSAKALGFFRQGQTIMSRLTKLRPDNAEWKQDLAEFNQEIAELAER